MAKRIIYSIYNPPPARGVEFVDESRTKQEYKDDCDINTIIMRYLKTGLWHDPRFAPVAKPIFDDFTSQDFDYQAMHNAVIRAQEQFAMLPAHVRQRFNNSPGALLEFLQDSANRDEAIKLGLIEVPVVVESNQPASTGEAGSAPDT